MVIGNRYRQGSSRFWFRFFLALLFLITIVLAFLPLHVKPVRMEKDITPKTFAEP